MNAHHNKHSPAHASKLPTARSRGAKHLVTCLVLVLAWCMPLMVMANPQRPSVDDRMPLVVVRALGEVAAERLHDTCRSLLAAYPVRCEVRDGRSLLAFSAAWNGDRGQLDARRVLELMFRARDDGALAELDITPTDIYEQSKAYVFGLASLTDRVAIVSLARILDEDAGGQRRTHQRLNKLVLHEVGHMLGLPHHQDLACVMRQDPTPDSLDTAPGALCEHCHRQLTQRATVLARPGQIELDRTRGHLVRGEADLARSRFVRALWSSTLDAEILNGFGVAFLESRQLDEAIGILTLAAERNPSLAEAHVNRGLALQLRAREGDLELARAAFRTALELRPQWPAVTRHLQAISEPARAQGPEAH